jgi:hypothetical protein
MSIHKWNFEQFSNGQAITAHSDHISNATMEFSISTTARDFARGAPSIRAARLDENNTGNTTPIGNINYAYNMPTNIFNASEAYYMRAYFYIAPYYGWSTSAGPYLLSHTYGVAEGLQAYYNGSSYVFSYLRGASRTNTSNVMPTYAWFRAEVYVRPGNSTTDVGIFTGANVDGTSPTYSFSSATNNMSLYSGAYVYPGMYNPAATAGLYNLNGYPFYFDDIAIATQDYGWIGPEASTAVKRGYGIVRV